MTERAAFLKAVIEDPSEANRLPFADWLEDHGEGELAGWVREPHPPVDMTLFSDRGYGNGSGNGDGSSYGCGRGDGEGRGTFPEQPTQQAPMRTPCSTPWFRALRLPGPVGRLGSPTRSWWSGFRNP